MKNMILFAFFPVVLLAAPQAPSNLSLTPTAHDVNITWDDNSQDETGFKIYRDGVLIRMTDIDVTHFVDRGLSANTSYTYTVKATDDPVWVFDEVGVPWGNDVQREVLSTNKLTIGTSSYDMSYHTIIRSGDSIGNQTYGLVRDKYGQAILNADGSEKVSHVIDYTSILPVGNKLFMISNFETTPSAMYITELNQSSTTGELSAISTKPIDFSAFNGVAETCAGSVTPWNTHLAGEESLTSARWVDADGSIDYLYDRIALYDNNDITKFTPYDYGWMVEVALSNAQGDVNVSKHYAMGRFAHELGMVMPDEKTVYLSNDNKNGLFYKFVADTAKDLSAGTLYAAKWNQTSAVNGATADITWISLGHATDAQIKAAIADQTIRFSDMLDGEDRDANNHCPAGYLPSNWAFENTCLKVKAGMDVIASRLESGRYGGMMGATTEFSYMEGLAYNPTKNHLYLSMSTVAYGMENNKNKNSPDTKYDKGGNNDIRVDKSNRCGIVYTMVLDNNYNGVKIEPLLAGKEQGERSCSNDHIATPDNLAFMKESNSLIIGEDSYRDNNMLWSFNVDTKRLTRIQTAPFGAEITSVKYYPNIHGFAYLLSIIQHPFEGDFADAKNPTADELKGYTGYIGPLVVGSNNQPPKQPPVAYTVEGTIQTYADDAEEEGSGSMSLYSDKLELTKKYGENQTIGLRFHNLHIPKRSHITNAYITLYADATSSGTANLRLYAEDSGDAGEFMDTANDLTQRTLTASSVVWNTHVWTAGEVVQTPNIANLIQTVVNKSTWQKDNHLAIIIKGSGESVAVSKDGNVTLSPVIHIEYER